MIYKFLKVVSEVLETAAVVPPTHITTGGLAQANGNALPHINVYAGKLTWTKALSESPARTLRAFDQAVFIDIAANKPSDLSLLAARATAVLLTNLDKIIARVNEEASATDTFDVYQSLCTVRTVQWQSHTPNFAHEAPFCYQIELKVSGDFKAIKLTHEGDEVIKKVVMEVH